MTRNYCKWVSWGGGGTLISSVSVVLLSSPLWCFPFSGPIFSHPGGWGFAISFTGSWAHLFWRITKYPPLLWQKCSYILVFQHLKHPYDLRSPQNVHVKYLPLERTELSCLSDSSFPLFWLMELQSGLGRTLKIILLQSLSVGRDMFHWTRLLHAPSNLALDIQRIGQPQLLWTTWLSASAPSHRRLSSIKKFRYSGA